MIGEKSICLSCGKSTSNRLGGSKTAWVCQVCNDEVLKYSPMGGKLLYSPHYRFEIYVPYIDPITRQKGAQ